MIPAANTSRVCRICGSSEHVFSSCPVPLANPRSPRKEEESERVYARRLRTNEIKRLEAASRLTSSEGLIAERERNRRRYGTERTARRLRVQNREHDHRSKIQGLKTAPCQDCGNKFPPVCMDFDHRPGEVKLFGISAAVRYSWDVILAEMAKCDLVCANCHRIRTEERRQAQKVLP